MQRALLAGANRNWKEAASLGSAAVEPLLVALQDRDWQVRKAAAEALKLLHWQPMDAMQRALLAVASCKWKEAASLGSAAVEPLLVALQDDTPPVMQQLTEMLVAALQGEDWVMQESSVVRRAAAEALGKIRDARAVEPLIAALKDANEDVQYTAAEALRSMVDARAVHALITMACAHPEGAHRAIALLHELLERAAGGIVAEDLRALTRLNNVVGIVTRTEGGPCGEGILTYTSKEPVDCFQVRQLARQELIRRGLEA
jgi:HEAT repeat protein